MAYLNRYTRCDQMIGQVCSITVAASDGVALPLEQLGQGAHAAAADANEMIGFDSIRGGGDCCVLGHAFVFGLFNRHQQLHRLSILYQSLQFFGNG